MVVVKRWDNAETCAAAELPKFAISRFVVNYYGESDGAHRSVIKIERPVVVIPGRNCWVYCVLLQEIKGEFGLRK